MTKIERKLWLISFVLFVISLVSAAGVSVSRGLPASAFPLAQVENIRRALRPEREPLKVEQVVAIGDIQTLRIESASLKIAVSRDEHIQDLSVVLEGRFAKSEKSPLRIERNGTTLKLSVTENLNHLAWAGAFDDTNRNGQITVLLPRQWTGKLEIETVSGDTDLSDLSLGELDWSSVSGELDVQGGEVHIGRLKSVSGDIDYDSETMDVISSQTSGDAAFVIRGLDHFIAPKIDVQTVSGRLDLAISEKASVRISMSSFTGQTTSTVELKRSMHSGGDLEGQLGAGAGELRLRAVSGVAHLSTF